MWSFQRHTQAPAKPSAPARCHGVAVSGADQRQPAGLRAVGLQGLARECAAQIARQRHAHAYGKNPGFFQATVVQAGHITGGKYARVADRLQLRIHPHAAGRVQCQAGALEPRPACGLRDPKNRVRSVPCAVRAAQALGVDALHPRVQVHVHPALA